MDGNIDSFSSVRSQETAKSPMTRPGMTPGFIANGPEKTNTDPSKAFKGFGSGGISGNKGTRGKVLGG